MSLSGIIGEGGILPLQGVGDLGLELLLVGDDLIDELSCVDGGEYVAMHGRL